MLSNGPKTPTLLTDVPQINGKSVQEVIEVAPKFAEVYPGREPEARATDENVRILRVYVRLQRRLAP